MMTLDNKHWSVSYHPPGKGIDPSELNVGDIGLTRNVDSLMGKAISMVDGGFFCHSFSVYKPGGIIAESLELGTEVEDIEKYHNKHHYAIIHLDSLGGQQDNMFRFMNSVVNSENNKYGYFVILSLLLSKITNFNLNFGAGVGTNICSGFSSEVSVRAGYIYPKPTGYISPNDLQNKFKVNDPTTVNRLLHTRATGETK
jgi:hypothetical protein